MRGNPATRAVSGVARRAVIFFERGELAREAAGSCGGNEGRVPAERPGAPLTFLQAPPEVGRPLRGRRIAERGVACGAARGAHGGPPGTPDPARNGDAPANGPGRFAASTSGRRGPEWIRSCQPTLQPFSR